MKTFNPANRQLIKDYPEHSLKEVENIIQQSELSYQTWAQTSINKRALCTQKMAQFLRADLETYAKLMTQEMGKPITQSRKEILKCASACEYYAKNAEEFLKKEPIKSDGSNSYVVSEPLGIILGIMPWNFPFWQVFRFAAPTLMAGNAIVLKHAPNTLGSALAIEELFRKADFPKDLFRVLLIDVPLVKNVIFHSQVKAVTLTGSDRAGASVAAISGEALKKTVLELGGSDPFIVLEDADLNICVPAAISARLINTGQSCIAAKRFIIAKPLFEQFCSGIVERLKMMKIGDPLLDETEIGPLARVDLLEKLRNQVDSSISRGAKLLFSHSEYDGAGFFYPPKVLTNAKKGMPIYDEEIFGPVFVIFSAENEKEAIKIANDTPFGLGASLWSQNIKKAEQLAREIKAGTVYINAPVVSNVALPFGGVKKSGYGRELSYYGIKEFVNIKTVSIS